MCSPLQCLNLAHHGNVSDGVASAEHGNSSNELPLAHEELQELQEDLDAEEDEAPRQRERVQESDGSSGGGDDEYEPRDDEDGEVDDDDDSVDGEDVGTEEEEGSSEMEENTEVDETSRKQRKRRHSPGKPHVLVLLLFTHFPTDPEQVSRRAKKTKSSNANGIRVCPAPKSYPVFPSDNALFSFQPRLLSLFGQISPLVVDNCCLLNVPPSRLGSPLQHPLGH